MPKSKSLSREAAEKFLGVGAGAGNGVRFNHTFEHDVVALDGLLQRWGTQWYKFPVARSNALWESLTPAQQGVIRNGKPEARDFLAAAGQQCQFQSSTIPLHPVEPGTLMLCGGQSEGPDYPMCLPCLVKIQVRPDETAVRDSELIAWIVCQLGLPHGCTFDTIKREILALARLGGADA